ncbi:dihydrofolate reductase family protein [Planococcus sp. FY231025]|uniref:dihydrofolate reductase family protein n=1 Tax=Planococcus sp. FY231025 TaxID=3455699 RepID=UPI003F938F25
MENERKISCFIAASLDGYIATKDDSLDWLFKVEGEGDAGYADYIKNVDTIVMGRRTYEWVMEQESGNFPYTDQECFVFTSARTGSDNFVTFTDEDVAGFADRLKKRPGKDIWVVGGSQLLYAFLEEGLIDEFIISIAPTLIGSGIPLFRESATEQEFTLKSVKQYGQFAQLHLMRK